MNIPFAWLIGLLVGVAALGLGYALVSLGQLVLARVRALDATGRRSALLARYYQPWRLAEVAWPAPLVALWALLRHAPPLTFAPSVGGLVVAALARDPVFSTYLVLVGAGMTLYLVYRGTLRAQQTQSDTVRRLLDAFVGLYRVNPTTFTTLALASAQLPAGPVRTACEQAGRHYDLTRDTHAALQRLLTVTDPYLVRFVLVLDQAGEQGAPQILRLLTDLQGRARRRWTTRLAAQGVFAALRSTLTVLFGVALVVITVSVIMPLWRNTHTASGGTRVIFIALTLVALAATAFFDRRMRLDEETLL